MDEQKREEQLEALNRGAARSQEELAALAARVERLVEWTTDNPSVVAERRPARGAWRSLWHGLHEAGVEGGRLGRGVADEIERHPVLGGMAAFGLGFWVATLLFKKSAKAPRR